MATVNVETVHNQAIDARVTATVEFHIKNDEVVHVNVTIKDGLATKSNVAAIRNLLECDPLGFLDD